MALVVVCYDVADDGRRDRLRKLLRRYGDPVEESVFHLDVSAAKLAEVRRAAVRLVDREQDIVRFYTLCGSCRDRIDVVVGPPDRPRPLAHVV